MTQGEISFGPASITVRWKVRGFCSLPPAPTRVFDSRRFRFLDAEWCLQANGCSPSDWIRLWVYRSDSDTPLNRRLCCRMWIEKRDGTEIDGWYGEFGVLSCVWSTPALSLSSEALRGQSDPLIVLCRISTYERGAVAVRGTQTQGCECIGCLKQETTSGETLDEEEPVPEATGVDKLAKDFKDLLSTGVKSDLILRVRDQEFKCHEAVLSARAPVFAAWMEHDRKDGASGTVQVKDCDDPAAFALFLEHLYTGGVEILSTNTVFALYHIADKYGANDLKSTCVGFMSSNMSVQTFCYVLNLTLQYDESRLDEVTTAFFSKNMREIMATAEWEDFLKDNTAEGNLLLMKALDLNAGMPDLSD